jgi:hypothetical protein
MQNDIVRGIIETANSVGANPLELATIMSYETAGTFDPRKRGPRTQHGQHRGFIQFGEPQAAQFGVDWNDPVRSQLGPGKAVAKYLTASGFKPGMGLLDLYSTVNAGAPGLYNRSDANNGGAPGTVADKVNNQMAGHRRNAEQLLGGSFTMPASAAQGMMAAQPTAAPQMFGNLIGATPVQTQAVDPSFGLATMFLQQQATRQERQKEEREAEEARRLALFSADGLAGLYG